MSNARKLADLLSSTGDVKTAHLDNVPDNKDVKALKTKFNLNLGITPFEEEKK
jgi:hypothetical protein